MNPRGKATKESKVKVKQSKKSSEQNEFEWSAYSGYAKRSNLAAVPTYSLLLECALTVFVDR
jgi:hypothetical protein